MAEAAALPRYPVRLHVDYPERQSRWKALVRLPLSIPVFIFIFFMNLILYGVGVLWLAILIRGRPPRWLFDMIVGANRARARARAYILLLTDEYPTFEGPSPLNYDVVLPERISRWRLLLWKLITALPHWIILQVLQFAQFAVLPIVWAAILITGRYPKGLHTFVTGVLRWERRVEAYALSLTDQYPPFSLAEEAGPAQRSSSVISSIIGVLVFGGIVGGITASVIALSGRQTTVEVSYQDLLDDQVPGFQTAVVADSFVVALTGAQDPADASYELLIPEEGARFVELTMHAEEVGGFYADQDSGKKQSFYDWDFRLKDTNGKTHAPFLALVNGRTLPETILLGDEGEIRLVFELGQDIDPAELRYKVAGRFIAPIVYRFV